LAWEAGGFASRPPTSYVKNMLVSVRTFYVAKSSSLPSTVGWLWVCLGDRFTVIHDVRKNLTSCHDVVK